MDAIISISGNVGTDVEVKTTRTGQPMGSFRLGSTPRYRGGDGEWTDGETTWVTVRCYRWLAENAANSLRRGDPVLVQGRLRTSVWTDDKGVRHERSEVEATSLGHDLSRGTTHFRRADRAGSEAATEAGAETGPGSVPAAHTADPWATPGVTGQEAGQEAGQDESASADQREPEPAAV